MEATKILLVILLVCVCTDAWSPYHSPSAYAKPVAAAPRRAVTIRHVFPETFVHQVGYVTPLYLHHVVKRHGQNRRYSAHRIKKILKKLESCPNPTSIKCDGPWTIIQRRVRGGVNFNRSWEQYKWGFPSHHGHDFWLGLVFLHRLTERRPYVLRVTMKDKHGIKAEANYGFIKVDSEANNYKLHLGRWLPYPLHNCSSLHSMRKHHGGIHGGSRPCNAMDALQEANGLLFSTYDRDNDRYDDGSCAQKYGSGFWFGACFYANPNGHYGDKRESMGIVWDTFRPMDHSLVFFEMAIKPKHKFHV